MPYLVVTDFKGGLDTRRSQDNSPSGTLFEASNVHISRGGEVEKRFAFVRQVELGDATVGLAATVSGPVTFGVGARPASLDANVGYQDLAITTGSPYPALIRILDWDIFGGKLYLTALYADGTIAHWYDGLRVTDWTPPAPVSFPTSTDPQYQPVMTRMNKMYAGAANFLFFSKLDDPRIWQVATPNGGQGYIDQSNIQGGAERVTGLAPYQGKLAAFSRRSVQIWDIDPDPAKYRLSQALLNIGSNASRSIISFGDTDVFFLADSGVRSLRARDSSNTAAASDIGTPVDSLITAEVQSMSAEAAAYVCSTIEPRSGRYWLALGRRIYVFSFFSSSRVSAWSRYDLSFSPTEFATVDRNQYVRGDDGWLYLYGGLTGTEYGSDYLCTVELSLLDGGKPATEKMVQGIDVSCTGAWEVRLGTDPANPDTRELIATVNRVTYGMERIAATGQGTHFSYELKHQGAGPATLNALATHYQPGGQD